MGNRAYIMSKHNNDVAVYVHWNGGADSIVPLFDFLGRVHPNGGFKGDFMDGVAFAQFIQVFSNAFGEATMEQVDGSDKEKLADGIDNGVYVVDGWNIVEKVKGCCESAGHDYDEMLVYINSRQPQHMQLSVDMLSARQAGEDNPMQVGDVVWSVNFGKAESYPVLWQQEEDRVLNGYNIKGRMFIDRYGVDNINSYVEPENSRYFIVDKDKASRYVDIVSDMEAAA